MINVTKTFLPPQSEHELILRRAWNKGWITNRGILVKELEFKLKDYLKVPNIIATTNGTLPIQIALKALKIKGEVITTPFSYVATTSTIVWENCSPVFVDIHPEYLTIDESKIEKAITDKTSAILITHVFGNPCNVEVIEKLAKRYKLKVIYDAAHCFGVNYKEKSIFNYGDISTCSFHATKLFHTGEGGAMFTKNSDLNKKLFYQHNFGHDGPMNIQGFGINAKMSELQAALGLSIFPYINKIIDERKKVVDFYKKNIIYTKIQFLKIREGTQWNYSYFPIIFKNENDLLKIENELKSNGIFPRRYFYPSLNTLAYVKKVKMPISESISSRVLCLPLYVGLKNEDLRLICSIVNNNI